MPAWSSSGCAGGSGSYGFDAATGKYGDLMEAGIIDPTKVGRLALDAAMALAKSSNAELTILHVLAAPVA